MGDAPRAIREEAGESQKKLPFSWHLRPARTLFRKDRLVRHIEAWRTNGNAYSHSSAQKAVARAPHYEDLIAGALGRTAREANPLGDLANCCAGGPHVAAPDAEES